MVEAELGLGDPRALVFQAGVFDIVVGALVAEPQAHGGLAHAYLPQQDLASGTLRIIVVEGRLEGLDSSALASPRELAMSFPGRTGERGDLELRSGTLRNAGSLVASRALEAKASQALDNQGGSLKGATVRVDGPSPSISAVRIRIAESSVRPPWPSPPISAATPL